MIQGIKTIINRIRDILGNREYDVTIRSFVYIGFGGIIVAFAMSVYYFLSEGDSIYNGILIFISAVVLSVFMTIGISTYKMRLAALLSATWVSFILFPLTFFLGGGLASGSSIWFLMGFAYVTMILSGKLRLVFLILQLIFYSVCFFVSYFNPDFSVGLSASQTAVDSLVSVLVVGPAIMIMFYFKELIMREELTVAREQKKEIERLTRYQQNFFADMSRKIRTPIGGITGLNEMILRSDNLTEDVLQNTRNIASASDMLLTVLEDIMDMNKMQVGDIRIENLEYDTSALFTDLINMLEPKAKEKSLILKLDIDPEFPLNLFGDKIRMKQILVNVLNNAIKYTRRGYVKLSVKAETVGGTLIKAVYQVEDTGIGIKPEDMESLFSDFSRIDISANRSIEGTGLGLFITQGLLSAMGGTIEAESTYGEGSVFTITIPQNKSGEKTIGDINNIAVQDVGNEKTHLWLNGGRILIVDDDRMSREIVKKLLSDTGAIIDLCESGRQALKFTAENSYNIIFMDHVMPDMDGVETLHRMRTQTNGKNYQTLVVALTANAGENQKEIYQNIGFAGYLSKPVNISLLEEYVIKSMPEEIKRYNRHREKEFGNISNYFKKKVPVLITTDSMAGLSQEDITKYGIEIFPYCISMPDGSAFVERQEIDIEAMRAVQNIEGISAEVVNVEMAADFFRQQLEKAENVIHICIMSADISGNYERLCGVADNVGHVTIFESGTVSVGAGIMAVHAAKLASEGYQMIHIINELIELRKRIEFRCRIGEINLLVSQRRFPKFFGNVLKSFHLQPLVKTDKSGLKLYGLMHEKNSMEEFVERILKEKTEFEDEIYIAHPDVRNNRDEIYDIKNMIKQRGRFKNIVVIQSSPIMVANSGMNSLAVAMVKKHE